MHFKDIIKAKPRQPEYLMPWSYLRAAQCAAKLGNRAMAASMINEVVKSPDVFGIHKLAQQLLSEFP